MPSAPLREAHAHASRRTRVYAEVGDRKRRLAQGGAKWRWGVTVFTVLTVSCAPGSLPARCCRRLLVQFSLISMVANDGIFE